MKCRIAVDKEALNKTKRLLCGPLDRKSRTKIVNCLVWSVIMWQKLKGEEEEQKLRREGRKGEEKRLQALERGCGQE